MQISVSCPPDAATAGCNEMSDAVTTAANNAPDHLAVEPARTSPLRLRPILAPAHSVRKGTKYSHVACRREIPRVNRCVIRFAGFARVAGEMLAVQGPQR